MGKNKVDEMKRKVCIRKDGAVFPYTPILEAKGFAVDVIEVGAPVADAPAPPAHPTAPSVPVAPVDDTETMTKAQLIEYAARVFNVSLMPTMHKLDMLAELDSLKADADKPPA
jgi:hypothetical protein